MSLSGILTVALGSVLAKNQSQKNWIGMYHAHEH